MKTKTVRFLERFSPPGMDAAREARQFGAGAIAAFVFSLGFVIRCLNERGNLFEWNGLENVLIPGSMMPDFTVLLGMSLYGFYILAAAALLMSALRYGYFHQDGKSIYTMRRLPRPETAKRCLIIPALGAALSMTAAFIMLCLLYLFYLAVTPAECLPPEQWQKIWSVI